MIDTFDPYYTWLGIPPEEQPPNHYRLLGVAALEENIEAIGNAADRQMAHLRTLQSGPHGGLSQKLLNEVAAAKVTLLHAERKAEYDRSLRLKLKPRAAPKENRPKASRLLTATPLPEGTPPPQFGPATVARQAATRQRIVLGAAAVVGVAAILWIASLMFGGPGGTESGELARGDGGETAAGADVPEPEAVETGGAAEVPAPAPSIAPSVAPAAGRPPVSAAQPVESTPADPAGSPSEPASQEVASQDPVAVQSVAAQPAPEQGDSQAPGARPPVAGGQTAAIEPAKPAKFPVPSPEQQRQILTALAEVYELGKTRTPEEKLKLAGELVSLGADPSGIPAERFVMLRKAMELAGEAGNPGAMLAAIDAMGTANFDIDTLGVQGKTLAGFAAGVKEPAAMKSLMECTSVLVEAALAEKRYDVAHQALKAAHSASESPSGLQYRKELSERLKGVEGLLKKLQAVEQAKATLQTNPDDPAANSIVGRWFCLAKDDWEQGLPNLAKGSDPDLRNAAQKELASPPAQAEAMVAIADAWYDLGEKATGEQRDALWLHAGSWYEKAADGLPAGLMKVKVAKRIEEIAKIDRPVRKGGDLKPGSLLPPGRWVDLLQYVEPTEEWQREGEAIVARPSERIAERDLPVSLDGAYDLQLDYTIDAGHGYVDLRLPVKNHRCSVMLNYKESSGLGPIDGRSPRENPTSRRDVWAPGRKYAVLAKVRPAGEDVTIDVLRDGEPFLNWSGKLTSLEPAPEDEAAKAAPRLFTFRSNITFHQARVQLLSGRAVLAGAAGGSVAAALAGNADPLSFVPSPGTVKNGQGAWQLNNRNQRLTLAKPIESPWALDFDFLLPERHRGFIVTFGKEVANRRMAVVIFAHYVCGIGWNEGRDEEGVFLARVPREAMSRIQPGQLYRARIMARKGAVALWINGQPALQAADPAFDPAGSIAITGRPALVGNLVLKPVK